MIEIWFNAHIYDGVSLPDQTKSLKTPSLYRARDFIDTRLELGALFGCWMHFGKLDVRYFHPDWEWAYHAIQHEYPPDSWVSAGYSLADSFFENAKYYSMIIAPANFEPPENRCTRCSKEVAAIENVCPQCSRLIY